jgi:alkylation response protein AidB-like acyl-CoA dehydrogenase
MDFDFAEEQMMLKDNVRNFLEKEIAPVVDEHEKAGPLTKEAAVGFIRQLMPFG